jgi:predicted lactoylglutathione lyase
MGRKIFVNLPVKDLEKSIDFFSKLGFTFNPQFTDETATCMIVAEDIFVMLMTVSGKALAPVLVEFFSDDARESFR